MRWRIGLLRAVNDLNCAAANRQPVITVLERFERVRGESVFLREAKRRMAGGADLLSDIVCVDGRCRIPAGSDVVLTVAIRAGGRVGVAFSQGVGVNAGVEFAGDLCMAFCACPGDVELVHPCAGGHRAVHLVGAVAIDAVGRFHVATDQRRAVHALVERAHELHSA